MTRLMMMVGFLAVVTQVYAQKYTVESYIDEFKYISIEEMNEAGIPASITLAQGILESRYGNSELTLASNNHFGIKCHNGWTGKRYYHDDDRKDECFRVYKNPEQSFRDHTDFLTTRSRYDFLFDYSSTDYKKWAHGLKKAGYATNPKYGHLLVDLIERHQLYLYDRPGSGVVAKNKHSGRHHHQDVKTNGDYNMHDNTVHTKNSVNAGSPEAVFSYNRIRTVAVGKYDNIQLLAERHFIPVKRLLKYNDLKPGEALREGQLIYLQPKRGRAEKRIHIVDNNETLWDISQLYGVKLYKLRQRNQLASHEEPANGETIYLNRKADVKPKTWQSAPIYKQNKDEVIFETADIDNDLEEIIDRDETSEKQAPVIQQPEAVKVDRSIEVQVKEAKEVTEKKADPYEPVAVPRNKVEDDEADVIQAGSSEEKIYEKEDALVEKQISSVKKFHTVKKGDTLYGISKLYSVTIDDLKSWNKLESNLISLDQKLIIAP